MSRVAVQGAVCRQLEDVLAVAVETQAQPARLCRQLGELLQNTDLVGIGEGIQAAAAQRCFRRNTVAPAAQHLPCDQRRTTGLGIGRKLQRLFSGLLALPPAHRALCCGRGR